MRVFFGFSFICLFPFYFLNAQITYSVKGKILDYLSQKELAEVSVLVFNSTVRTRTDENGNFELKKISKNEFIIEIVLNGYESLKIPITIKNNLNVLNIGDVNLAKKKIKENNNNLIELSGQDLLDNEKIESNTISGLLQSSKDVIYRTFAYEFSSTFFRPRFLDSEYSEVLLNGVSMNKIYNGRPQWANWGGLNDVLRNQIFSTNMSLSRVSFGKIGGTLNISTQSSNYRKGVKISYAASNRSYNGRIMASYSSGFSDSGWAYTISASRRFANEGFRDGTLYNANSFFASIQKRINMSNQLNFTIIFASNERGKSSPITQEVFNLKNLKYNAYWGDQEGKIRNSRVRKIKEPIFQLNYFWRKKNNISIQTNVTYQFGTTGNSRLDYGGSRIVTDGDGNQSIIGGGINPDPTYYQKLPSYFLKDTNNPDYTGAYLAQQEFLKNGQINWQELYTENQNVNGTNSIYALYEDKTDDRQLIVNSILYFKLSKNISLNSSLGYRILKSENYAKIIDLLGGNGFLDVDVYGDNLKDAQNDLQKPNRIVEVNQRYKYNYEISAGVFDAFVQSQFNVKRIDAFMAVKLSLSNYKRTGLYEKGTYPGNRSLGDSKTISFTNYGIKGGLTYKLSGRHLFTFNAAYLSRAPSTKNSFSNVRENNDIVIGLDNEKIKSIDFDYFYRHPKINLKFNSYWVLLEDKTHISFYFADGLTGLDFSENTAFVQEVMTNIDQENVGIELGLEIPINPSFKLKGVIAIGQSVYKNNPNLYLTSDAFTEPLDYEKTKLENYFVSGGPQRAYSFGFEYNDPHYWWLGVTANYFSNAYVSVAPITRTKNFYTDIDGLAFNNYDPIIAQELLKQEEFDPYFLVNIVGGKSWKINQYYVGFFANVSNLLNTTYKTGGYEQSRNVNYETLLEDKSRDYPLFGPKYWYGYGTSFYASVYFRF